MGHKVGYTYLMKRLGMMLRIQGDYSLVDLGNNFFFLAKFSESEDKEYLLFGGLCMVSYHYLIVQTLHSNFDPYGVIIEKVLVWVRLPDLERIWECGCGCFSKCFSLENPSK
ncbi:hypothetical protein NC651_010857 [Populus alba x Populus x berolinensis]|nr:hypothetical protein NC651_010857 [Populus alba x Populus x berolinensis]